MNSESTYFFVAFVLSFMGSIPLGIITLTIIQSTIQKGRSSGVMIALGAFIMEFVYTYIALISLDLFADKELTNYIDIAATVVFFAMGIFFFTKKPKEKLPSVAPYKTLDFFKGIFVGAVNLLIVPFWVFLALWLKDYEFYFSDQSSIISFSLGSAVGALAVFFAYILLSEWVMKKSEWIMNNTNKMVGLFFLGLGIFQLIKLI